MPKWCTTGEQTESVMRQAANGKQAPKEWRRLRHSLGTRNGTIQDRESRNGHVTQTALYVQGKAVTSHIPPKPKDTVGLYCSRVRREHVT